MKKSLVFRLEVDVLTRFEQENGGELLVATLCLLEVSSRGLLELELLQILGDEDNLMPPDTDSDEGAEKGRRSFCAQPSAYSCLLAL